MQYYTPIEPILGCPDNPNSKAEDLFRGGNYLMNFQGGLNTFGDLLEEGGVIELHFQLFSEIPLLNNPQFSSELSLLKDYVNKARSMKINFMAHLPFLIDAKAAAITNSESLENYDGFFNMYFSWLVVPENYNSNPSAIPAIAALSKNEKKLLAFEAPMSDIFNTIELLNHLEIELLTVHVTKPGNWLNKKDLSNYIDKINQIQHYISETNSNVKLCIETGGVLPEELIAIHEQTGAFINMDVAHLLLDLNIKYPEKKIEEKEELILTFIKGHLTLIKNFHLTQTIENLDAHKGIFENGIISINNEIIQLLYEQSKIGNFYPAIVESKPDFRNFEYVHNLFINNFKSHKSLPIEELNAKIILIIGMPVSGKSTIRSFLEKDESLVIISDKVHEEILSNADSMTFTNFNEERRQIGYNTIYSQIEKELNSNREILIDATFDKRTRREKLFKILSKINPNRVYIFKIETTDEKFAKRAIEIRNKEIGNDLARGNPIKFALRDYDIYCDLLEHYEPFETDEFPDAHIASFSNDTNQISCTNKDTALKLMISKIKKGYLSLGIELTE